MSRAAIDDQYATMLESGCERVFAATHSRLSSPRKRGPSKHEPSRPFGGTTSTDVALLHHQLLLADNLGPARGLAFDVVAELLRRCRHRLEQLWCHEFF